MDQVSGSPLDEELSKNPFFPLLKSEYLFVFDKTGANRFTVLLPPSASLEERSGLSSLLESHIIRSEQINGRYSTVSGKWVTINDNRVTTNDGFDVDHSVQITGEHIIVNQKKKSVRILVVSEPLIPEDMKRKTSFNSPKTSVFSILPKRPTMQNYIDFLCSFPENAPVIQKMDDYIRDFNEHYIMIPGCESQVWKRIKSVWMDIIESLFYVNVSFYSCRNAIQCVNELHLAVESYILNGVFDVVYTGLCEIHQIEDYSLIEKIHEFQDITTIDLNIPAEFSCDFEPVINEFKTIFSSRTPIDKLRCLQSTIKLLTAQIEEHIERSQMTGNGPIPFTTDDLLCCLVYVIIKSTPDHMHADFAYMQNFRFSSVSMSELGFNLVTLQAAVAFIMQELSVPPADDSGNGFASHETPTDSSSFLHRPHEIPDEVDGVDSVERAPTQQESDILSGINSLSLHPPATIPTEELSPISVIIGNVSLSTNVQDESSPLQTSFHTPTPTPVTAQTPISSGSPSHTHSLSSSPFAQSVLPHNSISSKAGDSSASFFPNAPDHSSDDCA